MVKTPTGFSYTLIPFFTDSIVIDSSLSEIIQCNCASGNLSLNGTFNKFIFPINSLASLTVAHLLRIQGMNSNCVILSFPSIFSLYSAFPTKFKPAIPNPFSLIAS